MSWFDTSGDSGFGLVFPNSPTQQPWTEPRADSRGDQHSEQIPCCDKGCGELRAMQGMNECTDGSGGAPRPRARPTQPCWGKILEDPQKGEEKRRRDESDQERTHGEFGTQEQVDAALRSG